jgi:hypothetical protein
MDPAVGDTRRLLKKLAREMADVRITCKKTRLLIRQSRELIVITKIWCDQIERQAARPGGYRLT